MFCFDIGNADDIKRLFADCLAAQAKSYSPYSKIRVGACIYAKDGKKILGANIENASYSLTVCAERNAMFSARLSGYRPEDLAVLGIVGDFRTYAYPCGACRQVMCELLSPECPVVIFAHDGSYKIMTVRELMPAAFMPEDLQ